MMMVMFVEEYLHKPAFLEKEAKINEKRKARLITFISMNDGICNKWLRKLSHLSFFFCKLKSKNCAHRQVYACVGSIKIIKQLT